MRRIYFYTVPTVLLFLFANCECRRIIEDQKINAHYEVQIDTTSMVVRYPDNWNQDSIAEFKKEYHFKTSDADTKRCPCGDTNIEMLKWDFDNFSSGEIQTAKSSLKGGGAGAQGDEPFSMFIYPLDRDSDPYKLFPEGKLKEPQLKIIADNLRFYNPPTTLVPGGGDVNAPIDIAIIDTGLDLAQFPFSEPSLYPTAKIVVGCPAQTSGWDFANEDENTWDDHGHGTYVTRIIKKHLNKQNIPFRILPIKAFNKDGKGEYWDMICAMNYIKKINQNPESKIDILNASFGYGFGSTDFSTDEMTWYKDHSVFRSLLEEIGQETIVFGSAGNVNLNIDVLKDSNYPASFPSENLIGVGGYSGDTSGSLKSEGNFGPTSLDIAAPYTYQWGKLFYTTIQGSSFSTARMTALGAQIKRDLRNNGQSFSPADIIRVLKDPSPNNPYSAYYQNDLSGEIDEGRIIRE